MNTKKIGIAGIVSSLLTMIMGNIVSVLGAGLACPDWPLCHGKIIPPLKFDVLLEYSHRLLALISSILIIIITILSIRIKEKRNIGISIIVLITLQIILGGLNVILKLNILSRTFHLIVAHTIIFLLIRFTFEVKKEAFINWLIVLIQITIGGIMRFTGTGTSCPNFPLCHESFFPTSTGELIHFIHRWFGFLLLTHITIFSIKQKKYFLPIFFLIQILLGVMLVLMKLHTHIRITHGAIGYLLPAITLLSFLQSHKASK